MLRNMIVDVLGTSKLENDLSRHLHNTCLPDSPDAKVVTEISTFLVNHRFSHLVTALDPNASTRDIVRDFVDSVKICLIIASDRDVS